MKLYTAVLLLAVLTAGPAFSQENSREKERDEIFRQLESLRAVLDSLKALNNQDDAIEALEERLEKRFTDLENKINNAVRGTSSVIFNPRTTAFINFAARGDNKTAYNEDGSVEIGNRPFLRSTELDFSAPVDPYAEAVAILGIEDEAGQGFAIDPEEVYGLIKRLPLLESAPMGMKLKVGKFRAPLGVGNRLHLHDLPWTTRPLVISKFLGTEHGDFFESGFNPIGADLDFFLPNPIPHTTLVYDTFQQMIADYNAGATNAEALFAQLVDFAKKLNEEERRGIREQLDDEQLAIFDILTRPSPSLQLTKAEREQVERLARELLDTLKAERLVLEWRSRQQTRAAVFVAIQNVLENLPQKYSDEEYNVKCEAVYQHVYDSYYGAGGSVYAATAEALTAAGR